MSLRKELENLGTPRGAPQIPPLRYAPVGMTILFGNAKYSFQDELSSRPERSGAEGSAVRPSDFPNSGVLTPSSYLSRSASKWSATRMALAMIVSDGLTALADTKQEASTT